jgi:enamine deaminase RidA (YjgF/YER057c/UK114 family)
MAKQFLGTPESDAWLQTRAFSSAVVTTGGKTVWLAGHIGTTTDSGESLRGDFEGQVRQTFRNIESTLAQVGGKLSDMVTMTVYVLDMSHGDRFVQLRHEILKKNFPCSALVGVREFANPDIMVEIMPVAVID